MIVSLDTLEYAARDLEHMGSPQNAKRVRACMNAWEDDQRRLRAAGWHSLEDDPPQGAEAVLLYNPSLDQQKDFPGHPVEVSNPKFARLNAVKHGYTHWCPIPSWAAIVALKPTKASRG